MNAIFCIGDELRNQGTLADPRLSAHKDNPTTRRVEIIHELAQLP
jgi:hypothetical protein